MTSKSFCSLDQGRHAAFFLTAFLSVECRKRSDAVAFELVQALRDLGPQDQSTAPPGAGKYIAVLVRAVWRSGVTVTKPHLFPCQMSNSGSSRSAFRSFKINRRTSCFERWIDQELKETRIMFFVFFRARMIHMSNPFSTPVYQTNASRWFVVSRSRHIAWPLNR